MNYNDGMDEKIRAVVNELTRRLMLREYRDSEIREAAEVLSKLQPCLAGVALGEELMASPFHQIQSLGLDLLDVLAGNTPEAQSVLLRPEVQERRKKKKSEYSGMAEVIKMWVRQGKSGAGGPPRDWSPHR